MEAEGFHLNRLFFFFFLAVWSLVGHLDLIMIREFYFSTFLSLSLRSLKDLPELRIYIF